MYELIILSLLMETPKHGYLIAKIINDIIGPYARVSNGRLYPLLAKLEQDGLITLDNEKEGGKHAESGRPVTAYKITELGSLRFQELMRDTSSNPGDYQKIFFTKVSAFNHIKPTDRLHLIEHYLNFSQAHILHLQTEREDLNRNQHRYSRTPQWMEMTLEAIDHRIAQWQLEMDWARQLREKVLAQLDEPQTLNIE
jgi:DNA-binding PadR family transcriptional regulator